MAEIQGPATSTTEDLDGAIEIGRGFCLGAAEAADGFASVGNQKKAWFCEGAKNEMAGMTALEFARPLKVQGRSPRQVNGDPLFFHYCILS